MRASGRHVVVVCDVRDDRADAWRAAARASGRGSLQLVDYRDLVGEHRDLGVLARVPASSVLRIESLGTSWVLRSRCIQAGFEGRPSDLRADEVEMLPSDDARLVAIDQWWRGWSRLLREVEAACVAVAGLEWVAPVDDILAMGDKRACRRALTDHAPQPPALGDDGDDGAVPRDSEELRAALARRGWHQAFVKLRYGAGAAGVLAYRWRAGQEIVFTSLRASTTDLGKDAAFHHSSRVRCVRDPSEVRRLVDWVLAQGAVVERWIPKRTWAAAGSEPAAVDFRAVCVAGRARHVVVRSSRSPLTNLHLGNSRAAGDSFRRDDPVGYSRVIAAAERAAGAFPRSLTAAVDVLLTGEGACSRALVLEVNSFGELLHGVTERGESPYDAAWRAIQDRHP